MIATLAAPAQAAAGYRHPSYADSLAEYGRPRRLARSGSAILVRPLAGRPSVVDAMGLYPLFSCEDWRPLEADLDDLKGELVCLSLVTDPFGDYDLDLLQRCFSLARPYKQHFVADLSRPASTFVSSHHRRNAAKAARAIDVERLERPLEFLDDWIRLYDCLIDRHHIRGLTAFSRQAFALQLAVPGVTLFRAEHAGQTVGALLWYVDGDVGYYHLGAYSPLGYGLGASFALFAAALKSLAREVSWLDLGAGSGLSAASDGLTRFKEGWSTGTRMAYFCGRIFDSGAYAELASRYPNTDYFPAYRQGEFA